MTPSTYPTTCAVRRHVHCTCRRTAQVVGLHIVQSCHMCSPATCAVLRRVLRHVQQHILRLILMLASQNVNKTIKGGLVHGIIIVVLLTGNTYIEYKQ